MKTPESVAKEFKAIVLQEKKMKQYEGAFYYKESEILIGMLLVFLRNEFTTLDKPKFLHLCDMASSYRPVAPHTFLTYISMRKKEKKNVTLAKL